MKFNCFKNKLFLLIFILFFYHHNIFANNVFTKTDNVCLNDKNFLYIKNSLKKKIKHVFYL